MDKTSKTTASYDMNDALADFAFGLIAMIDEANGDDKMAKIVKKYSEAQDDGI